jgi:hypothetical protein
MTYCQALESVFFSDSVRIFTLKRMKQAEDGAHKREQKWFLENGSVEWQGAVWRRAFVNTQMDQILCSDVTDREIWRLPECDVV